MSIMINKLKELNIITNGVFNYNLYFSNIEIKNDLVDECFKLIQNKTFDTVCGISPNGIPFSVLIADKMEKPYIYIRKASKQHGMKKQIEGEFNNSKTILFVTEIINEPNLIINLFENIKSENLSIKYLFCLIKPNDDQLNEYLRQNNIELLYLSTD